MKREITISEDGSPTIYVEELDEHYHSKFGARTESEHIFIKAGLNFFQKKNTKQLNILEIGLGTGLNAYLSVQNIWGSTRVNYYAIEKYPLLKAEWMKLNFIHSEDNYPEVYQKIHSSDWEKPVQLIEGFHFFKSKVDLKNFTPPDGLHLVYFDAFSPDVQPELWSCDVFRNIFNAMQKGAILVTYSVKGVVKQNLKAVGFSLEKLPGPRGKRHMLRTIK
ncbi:MAG: tRNA (5-methylaminomethyl-2-thiouridine)(34)-methyltransferase MnmD [Bacteroidota bacterium]